ncbi:MAG: hypothetical protein WC742_06230 [Gallionellaceae bacterium]
MKSLNKNEELLAKSGVKQGQPCFIFDLKCPGNWCGWWKWWTFSPASISKH